MQNINDIITNGQEGRQIQISEKTRCLGPESGKSIGELTPKAIARFWSKVEKLEPHQCWEWNSSKDKGYGVTRVNGAMRKSHRLAWIIRNGSIPDGMCVCHSCDNPSCCNHGHLFLGSNQDNVRDMFSKGREARGDRHGSVTHPESRLRGECSHFSRLSEVEVVKIIQRLESGERRPILAREYGVTRHTIGSIHRKETWKHLQ